MDPGSQSEILICWSLVNLFNFQFFIFLLVSAIAKRMPDTGITTVKASKEELEKGEWSIDNLRTILEAIFSDGICVLEDLIDPAHLDEMNKFMVPDALRIRESTDHLNFGTENVQQAPPMHKKELFFDDFYLNGLLFNAITFLLGPQAKWDFISGNTALPKSAQRQPVHADDKCPYMNSTYYIIANIPIIDFSPDNGVTEFWPGTHRTRSLDSYNEGNISIRTELLEERRKVRPPVQPHVKKGSIVIRDLMLWHSGMPNPSDQVRCMSALGFSAKWWKNDTKFKVPDEETGRYLSEEAAKHGITARTLVVSENYNESKDLHDFELNEDPMNRGSVD